MPTNPQTTGYRRRGKRGAKATRGVRRPPARDASALYDPGGRVKTMSANSKDLGTGSENEEEGGGGGGGDDDDEEEEKLVVNDDPQDDGENVPNEYNADAELDEDGDDYDHYDMSEFLEKQLRIIQEKEDNNALGWKLKGGKQENKDRGNDAGDGDDDDSDDGTAPGPVWRRMGKHAPRTVEKRAPRQFIDSQEDAEMNAKAEKENYVRDLKQRLRKEEPAGKALRERDDDIDSFLEEVGKSTLKGNDYESLGHEDEEAAAQIEQPSGAGNDKELQEFLDAVIEDPSGTLGRRPVRNTTIRKGSG